MSNRNKLKKRNNSSLLSQPIHKNNWFKKCLEGNESCFMQISFHWEVISIGQSNSQDSLSENQHPLGQNIWMLMPQLKGTLVEKCIRRAMADRIYCLAEIQDTNLDQWYEVHIFPSPEGLIAFFLDVTARKQKEQMLRESADRFGSAIDNTPIVVFTQDRSLCYTWIYNPHPLFADQTVLGKTDSELLPDEDAKRITEIKQKVMNTGNRERQEVITTLQEVRYVYDLTVDPLISFSEEVVGVICAAVDITSQKNAEEEIRRWKEELEDRVNERTKDLKELQNRFMDSVENERAKLSRELHDGVMQDIYAIAYSIVGRDEGENPGQQLEHIQRELIRINQALRNICRDLRPPTLSKLGLPQAIEEHVSRHESSYPELSIQLELIQDSLPIPEKSRLALFRIFQVAFTNVVRHAQAKHLEIRLVLANNLIQLEIKDDGVGFDVPRRWNELAHKGHLGLAGAFERAESMGGRMIILSAQGKGTTVRVEVPKPDQNS